MKDPIQRDRTLLEWFQVIGLDGCRRVSIWFVLGGVLLYMFGEISTSEWAVKLGIWLLLAGIAGAFLYKIASFFLVPSKQDD
jgi:hypothetical protein